jgi:hypothetical protein
MATSNFFSQNRGNWGEADLLHSLTNESIKIHGIDCYYVPKRVSTIDAIFEEDSQPFFNSAYLVEMYLNSVEGFGGEGDFLSKFGVEIRDQVTFTVARRAFTQNVLRYETEFTRPREGDLIFFPLNRKLFEIRFVEHESMFYNIGELYVFQLECELFEYSNEKFSTGIYDIDRVEQMFSTDVYTHALLMEDGVVIQTEDGNVLLQESYNKYEEQTQGEDNMTLEQEAEKIIDWTEVDPFSESGRY